MTLDWMERIAKALECHPADLLIGGTQLRNEKERAMIELFRGLSEEQQEAFLKAIAALAKPIADMEKKVANG